MIARLAAAALAIMLLSPPASGDDLYHAGAWAGLAADQRAAQVGDILTVIVYQNAEARNTGQNTARHNQSFDGSFTSGSIDEGATLTLDGAYAGQGEIRRSDSFVTQISVMVERVLPNGDLIVAGEQRMDVHGEETHVRVSGRVRPIDITNGNQVISTRIADARIDYDGQGFVSRNARPGFIQRLFGLLGLGG